MNKNSRNLNFPGTVYVIKNGSINILYESNACGRGSTILRNYFRAR